MKLTFIHQFYLFISKEPYPINLKLEPITKLKIGELVTPRVIDNLNMALEEYCSKLTDEGKLNSCSPPCNKLKKEETFQSINYH